MAHQSSQIQTLKEKDAYPDFGREGRTHPDPEREGGPKPDSKKTFSGTVLRGSVWSINEVRAWNWNCGIVVVVVVVVVTDTKIKPP